MQHFALVFTGWENQLLPDDDRLEKGDQMHR